MFSRKNEICELLTGNIASAQGARAKTKPPKRVFARIFVLIEASK